MLDSILYFLPCIVSLLWFVSFSFKVKTHRQTFFMWMLACQVFYFATYAVYISPVADYGTMVRMDAVCTPLTLTLAAMILIYQGMHIRRRRFRAGQLLLLLPAVIEGTIVNMLYYMVGFDNAARMAEMYDKDIPYPPEFQTEIYRLYDFFSEPFFSALGTAFTLAIIIRGVIISRNGGYRFGDAYRFFFRGQATTPSRAISLLQMALMTSLLPLAIMGRTYMMHHPILGGGITIFIALLTHCICHVEYYSDILTRATLYEMSHIKLRSQKVAEPEQTAEAPQPTPTVSTAEAKKTQAMIKNDLIAKKLRHLMEEEKLYKQEDISLATLSERLGVGRTTLSTMVNTQFGMSFRELVNHYRIEAVKHYMLHNPTAKQETIAYECGYKNASYMNSKFKEATGYTPLVWLVNNS